MIRVRWWTIGAIVATSALAVGAVLLLIISYGMTPWQIHPVSSLVLFVLAGTILWAGWQVRKLARNEPSTMTPLRAVKVLLTAQSCAILASIISGIMIAELYFCLTWPESTFMQTQLWGASAALFGAIVLLGSAMLVQHWCTVKPPDESPDSKKSIQRALDSSRPSPATRQQR